MAGKYHWLRLDRKFFDRHDIKIIESMPNGERYVLFLMKLMAESVDHEGRLRFSDAIPYNADMISSVTRTDVDTVRSALKLFIELGLMEQWDDETLYMTVVERMIGKQDSSTDRVRRFREKKALDSKDETDVTRYETVPSNSNSYSVSSSSLKRGESEKVDITLTTYRDELSRLLPSTAWRDLGGQTAALHRLTKMTNETQPTTPVETPEEFARMAVATYARMKQTGKGDYWKRAAFDPKGLELRFSDVVTEMAQAYGQERADEQGIEAMRRMGVV